MVISAIYFLLFFIGFLAAELIRFQYYLIRQPPLHSSLLWIILIAVVSGCLLFMGLKRLSLVRTQLSKICIMGGVFGLIWFWSVFAIEDAFTEKKLSQNFRVEQFADLQGHCGIHAGRALSAKILSPIENWRMSDRCRLTHWFDYDRKKKYCDGNFNCVMTIQRIFGSKGNWSLVDRKFFYQLLKQELELHPSTETLAKYFILDQELLKIKLPWYKQAGMSEEFNESFAVLQQSDELEHLMLSEEILNRVRSNPPTASDSYFSDTIKEVQFQVEKIPQLKLDLEDMKNKAKYSPSP